MRIRAHSARGLTSLDSAALALADRDLPLVRSAGSGLPASVSAPRFSIGYGSRSKKGSIYPAATRRPNVWISELSVCLTGYPVQKFSPPVRVLVRCRCPLPRMAEAAKWILALFSCIYKIFRIHEVLNIVSVDDQN